MIDDINAFTKAALEAAGNFKNIVTTTDQRFADFDAHRPAACWAIKPQDITNINLGGDQLFLPVRILILISDYDQQRGIDKMIALHKAFTGRHIEFSDPQKYVQEDFFRLDDNSPEVLVNTKKEYTLGIEYAGQITVDTTIP